MSIQSRFAGGKRTIRRIGGMSAMRNVLRGVADALAGDWRVVFDLCAIGCGNYAYAWFWLGYIRRYIFSSVMSA